MESLYGSAEDACIGYSAEYVPKIVVTKHT
jgi:hypothetical protein